ncbi:MAG: cytochrome C oxidase subunit IV family protein [Candidatus Sumerlaeaceae bacterium]|nr:cytochrome C oxidase subunit IV family protein [Candidatus Sumerlaeaceae bacterium]
MSLDHILTPRAYLTVFFMLLVLTAVTVYVAFIDFGAWSTPVAMAIAIIKATLVLLYFMHLRYSDGLTWLVIVSSFIMLVALVLITLGDVFTRTMTTAPPALGM